MSTDEHFAHIPCDRNILSSPELENVNSLNEIQWTLDFPIIK